MNAQALRELCQSHGFQLELHRLPAGRPESYFAILVPNSAEALDLDLRKEEIDLLRRKLKELCPSIEYITIQVGAD